MDLVRPVIGVDRHALGGKPIDRKRRWHIDEENRDRGERLMASASAA
jgi:hypothetical protein